ncbi:MAG: peptide chain release factor N(5)-glutamine methyltransferase [Verrucomicrobiota bacterium]|nr:peptide chain release factor N(5)-glutamine methyltransferase [Verrucomicrobiota bacterium]
MTVLEVIQKSTEFLGRKGVDSPRLQIELLLAHVLRMPRLKLYLSFDRELTEAELETLRELVRRRGNREPLQHLVGTVSFCGYEIAVNRDVFIPRPETELLAEQCWILLEQSGIESPTVVDVGTGSGCVAIALALRCPAAKITAVDISEAALVVARSNAARHRVEGRITFCCGDAFSPIAKGTRFDLIVSNPPYIPTDEISRLQPEVRDYDPRIALDGGADGLGFIRRLAVEAADYAAPMGRLMIELGDGQDEIARGIFGASGWNVEDVKVDDQGRPRILVARRC